MGQLLNAGAGTLRDSAAPDLAVPGRNQGLAQQTPELLLILLQRLQEQLPNPWDGLWGWGLCGVHWGCSLGMQCWDPSG